MPWFKDRALCTPCIENKRKIMSSDRRKSKERIILYKQRDKNISNMIEQVSSAIKKTENT